MGSFVDNGGSCIWCRVREEGKERTATLYCDVATSRYLFDMQNFFFLLKPLLLIDNEVCLWVGDGD